MAAPGTPNQQVNPLSLSIEEAARLLSAAGGPGLPGGPGGRVTVEQLRADIDAGAPVGRDGRINLVHYVAWLLREVQSK